MKYFYIGGRELADIKSLVEKHNDYIINMRRYFHTNPELSWEEFNTTKVIEKELKDMGIETYTFKDNKTGVIGILKGNNNGKTIALRADIDALPIRENTGLEFKSTNECMHACGHDCHTAMLLGAAKVLNELKDEINGNVKFIFQAAEETCCAAKYYIDQGILEDIDGIFGMHIWGMLPSSKINIEKGPRMASCDNFKIVVKGKASHGSQPNLGIDAIVISSAIVMNLQTFVSRNNNPLDPLVISIGTIHGGNRFNIIADNVVMEGTVRTFNRELRNKIEEEVRRIVKNTAATFNGEAELYYDYFPAPLINDEELSQIGRNAVLKLWGEEVFTPMNKLTGSEDFSYFSEKVPGAYAFLGCGKEEIGAIYPNHSDKFMVDEEALKYGAALYAQFAVDFLNK